MNVRRKTDYDYVNIGSLHVNGTKTQLYCSEKVYKRKEYFFLRIQING